tara:strand:+ start:670 stop:1680 length:1011 start_codon:yes stop_codon:yes gene_type:complete
MKYIYIVIPCYKSKGKISGVINSIQEVSKKINNQYKISIIIVNDACPLESWREIKENPNIIIIHHQKNKGVGASTLNGFKLALSKGADAVVKLDSDGQHPPSYLENIIPYLFSLSEEEASIIKGSRYLYRINSDKIPWARKLGSIFLEPIARVALSCRDLSDVSNGYLAMNKLTCRLLVGIDFGPNLNKRYLFESSLLVRSVFFDIPIHIFAMNANYEKDWNSSMESKKMILPLLYFWSKAGIDRLINKYLYRLNLGSLLLLISFICCLNSINLYFNRIRPFIKAGINVSAGNSSFFTTSSAIAIITILSFFLYDYNSGKKVKSVLFPVFLDELNT